MPTRLYSDVQMLDHQPGDGHPERPARLAALLHGLRERPVPGTTWHTAREATQTELERVHSPSHLRLLLAAEGQTVSLDPDTHTSPDTVQVARLAAGAAIQAAESALEGVPAFALVRPPGHHAERDRVMGFCLINNVVAAAEAALASGAVERVLILDWDLHHGNGTQRHFEGREDVLFFSTHRFPFYPGTGALHERGHGAGLGHTINVPLPAGVGDGDLRLALDAVLRPAADRFRPQLVLVSAGFDPYHDDPLGDMRVSVEGFASMCDAALDIARTHAQGRIALTLEGGYNLTGLTDGVRACLEVLEGATPPTVASPGKGERAVMEAIQAHTQHSH